MIEALRQDEQADSDWDAVLWIADRIMFGLEGAQDTLDRIADILRTARDDHRKTQS